MQLKIYDSSGKEAGKVDVPAGLLDLTPRRDVLHAVVVWQQANRRSHNAHTKVRSEVRGGGRKPWRQKGTGRARAGSRRSPIWRGGGTIFGPRTKEPNHKLPKKVRRLGLRMALADRATNDALKVVRGVEVEAPSTKQAKSLVDALGGKKTLVVLGSPRQVKGQPTATEKSFRNLDRVRVLHVAGLNVYDILNADQVLVDEGAMDAVVARLGGQTTGAPA